MTAGPSTADHSIWALANERWRGAGDAVALRFIAGDLTADDWSWSRLAATSERLAAAFLAAGLGAGDVVCTLLGRVPELYLTALASWRVGAVYSALFASFGPEPIASRLRRAEARALVTTAEDYRRKVAPLRPTLPTLRTVFLIDGAAEDCLSLPEVLARAPAPPPPVPAAAETTAFIHFTSGTTGAPKGAVHVHGGAPAIAESARIVLGYGPGVRAWCTADPGWITGVCYGIIAPLLTGATAIVDTGELEIERWYNLIARHRVESWYTAPTALRLLMRAGAGLPRRYDLSALSLIASVGEPLNAEVVRWGQAAFGLAIRDTWWQTETGAILIASGWDEPVIAGVLGRPLPGIRAAVVQRRGTAEASVISDPGLAGELAIGRPWPSMFRGYLKEPERTARCFAGDWYLTGDIVRRDEAGRFVFVGRADDIITCAGHRIGPFEVESALLEHPAVAEAGVIGKPDSLFGEIVKAFVVLKAPPAENEAKLRQDLLAFARRRLGAPLAPREIAFATRLPKTRSGKIMRRLLRCQDQGLPVGDTSTLADEGEAAGATAAPSPRPTP